MVWDSFAAVEHTSCVSTIAFSTIIQRTMEFGVIILSESSLLHSHFWKFFQDKNLLFYVLLYSKLQSCIESSVSRDFALRHGCLYPPNAYGRHVTGLEDCGWTSCRFGNMWIFDDSFYAGANILLFIERQEELS
jgi:hypothetical protein